MWLGSVNTAAVLYLLLIGPLMSHGQEYDAVVRLARDTPYSREPTCEELRAMWIFSKRQSRATEITNDIPTYRDPFAYNMWDPYPRTRNGAGYPPLLNQHVYGRIVHDAPWRLMREGSLRPLEHVDLLQGKVTLQAPSRRRKINYRLPGGSAQLPPISGSFQQLKEVVQNERARELQEQRLAENEAARAAAFQGRPITTYYGHVKDSPDPQETYPTSDKGLSNKQGVLTFPSLLLPSTQDQPDDVQSQVFEHSSYPQLRRVSITPSL